jgi:hypothetical protein
VIGPWHTDTLPNALALVPFAIPALLIMYQASSVRTLVPSHD